MKTRHTSALDFLLNCADGATLAAVRKRLRVEDRAKLVLLIVKQINSAEVLFEHEEAKLRGVSKNTLHGMKQRSEVPRVL